MSSCIVYDVAMLPRGCRRANRFLRAFVFWQNRVRFVTVAPFMRQSRPIRKTFPINAMLERRRVVVVGGGRVGQRKVALLLDAGAEVTLVCPACVDELTALARAGRIRHADRPFQDADVAAHALVFACTDDKHVNRHILEVAQAARVPCCCAASAASRPARLCS